MRFEPTPLAGVYVITPAPVADARGAFARMWCAEAFRAQGLLDAFDQCSVSFNHARGTLRGMHLQAAPHGETKLVRCTQGAIFDVALDARPGSPTFGRWTAVELTPENRKMLYVPEGVAHGFVTLEDATEVLYQIAGGYRPEAAVTVRWDDPAVGIAWPIAPAVMNDRDRTAPTLAEAAPALAARPREVVFWGGTGQAKVLRELLGAHRLALAAVVDNRADLAPPFADVPMLTGADGLDAWLAGRDGAPLACAVAIGGDRGRDRVALLDDLAARGLAPVTLVHPTAFVAPDAVLGEGCQVLAKAAVCVEAVLGRGCIVNTGATIDHECRLGDGVHVCPGAHLAGLVEVGDFATLGTGASVLPRIRIGEGAVVGAGAVVTRDVPAGAVVAGNPARALHPLERRST